MIGEQLRVWLQQHADALDNGTLSAAEVLPRLARSDILRLGVPFSQGGIDGSVSHALQAIVEVAHYSLTAAVVLWEQRTFIEYLLQSPNEALRERLLPRLLTGQLAGATGLSNAMKYLSGVETLQVTATGTAMGWCLDGRLPWVTNLRPQNFVAAIAVNDTASNTPRIFALPHDAAGVQRSEDLHLIALQSSHTAALALQDVPLDGTWLISADAREFLPAVRPAFLGLQCGLSIGLIKRALQEATESIRTQSHVLQQSVDELRRALNQQVSALLAGLKQQQFAENPVALFKIRIALAELVQAAIQLELQAHGGKAYLLPQNGFARRLRESAFIPVVTPSVVQLRTELVKQQRLREAA